LRVKAHHGFERPMSIPHQPPPALAGTPGAEVAIDADLVRRLLQAQHPDLADLPISHAATGWDNEMYRLGEDLAVRIPKRLAGAALILTEQRWLPTLDDLPLPIPAPVRVGRPGEGYPWSWSVQRWLPGEPVDLAPPLPGEGAAWGRFLRALHRPAPADAPRNPYRGVPLVQRQASFEDRVGTCAAGGEPVSAAILESWNAALGVPLEHETWLHGDPHAKNVLTQDGRFSAVVDFGDMCAGDPASDLASVWMLLPERADREACLIAYGALSDAMLERARGWAAWFGAMLLGAGLVDDPRLAAIGRKTLQRLETGP
jgi:aminoglycoside phosphotransferase (APT) family kinase protein